MAKIDEIKEYLRKLDNLIRNNAEFTFLDVKFVKKTKVDDLLCCFIAVLPDKYKKHLKEKHGKRLSSIIAYQNMHKALVRSFFFSKSLYMVEYNVVLKNINTIMLMIERDIAFTEKNEQ